MLIYNVHTLQKTFALTYIEKESFDSLLDRITRKSGLQSIYIQAVKSGQDGGLVYEYKGEKYTLEDDDDLEILRQRYPPSSTPTVTLHLTAENDGPQANAQSKGQGQSQSQRHAHAHFAPSPPSYHTAAGNIKSKAQKSSAQKDNSAPSALKNSNSNSNSKSSETNGSSPKPSSKSNGNKESSGSAKLAPPLPPFTGNGGGGNGGSSLKKIEDKKVDHKSDRKVSGDHKQSQEKSKTGDSKNGGNESKIGGQSEEKSERGKRAQSVMSTRSRKSRYGGDEDAEPMHVVHKRNWENFHANSGVRTIVGEVGGVPNVRMLLKSGHKNVYVSRQFAIKNGMVDSKYGMGSKGYTGLKILGNISITVGSKTGTHLAMISEEEHFDVVLGRVWLEKTGIKIDPIDQTLLTYMENGEVIPCDIVVLKDDQGNKIFIT